MPSGVGLTLQAISPSRERLNVCKSLDPKPPSSFALDINDQLFQWILLSLFGSPFQTLATKLLTSVHHLFGNKKMLIQYVGVAKANDFISTSYLTFTSLSFKDSRTLLLDLSHSVGMPK